MASAAVQRELKRQLEALNGSKELKAYIELLGSDDYPVREKAWEALTAQERYQVRHISYELADKVRDREKWGL